MFWVWCLHISEPLSLKLCVLVTLESNELRSKSFTDQSPCNSLKLHLLYQVILDSNYHKLYIYEFLAADAFY